MLEVLVDVAQTPFVYKMESWQQSLPHVYEMEQTKYSHYKYENPPSKNFEGITHGFIILDQPFFAGSHDGTLTTPTFGIVECQMPINQEPEIVQEWRNIPELSLLPVLMSLSSQPVEFTSDDIAISISRVAFNSVEEAVNKRRTKMGFTEMAKTLNTSLTNRHLVRLMLPFTN